VRGSGNIDPSFHFICECDDDEENDKRKYKGGRMDVLSEETEINFLSFCSVLTQYDSVHISLSAFSPSSE
jgi:hypothetical protein